MNYAENQEWVSNTLWGPFDPSDVLERGIADPGIGGPFLYKQILSIHIPKQNQNTKQFVSDVTSLGLVSLLESNDEIEIRGYSNET